MCSCLVSFHGSCFILQQNWTNIVSQILAREDLHERTDPARMQAVLRYLIELIGKNATDIDSLVKVFFTALESNR